MHANQLTGDTRAAGQSKGQKFFSQSVLHAGMFLGLGIVAALLLIAEVAVAVRYWGTLPPWASAALIALAYTGGLLMRLVYKAHEEIREQFLTGTALEVRPISAWNCTLSVAERALHYTMVGLIIGNSVFLWACLMLIH